MCERMFPSPFCCPFSVCLFLSAPSLAAPSVPGVFLCVSLSRFHLALVQLRVVEFGWQHGEQQSMQAESARSHAWSSFLFLFTTLFWFKLQVNR